MSLARVNKIQGQPFVKLQEYPIRGKRHFFPPRYGSCLSVYREAFMSDEK